MGFESQARGSGCLKGTSVTMRLYLRCRYLAAALKRLVLDATSAIGGEGRVQGGIRWDVDGIVEEKR